VGRNDVGDASCNPYFDMPRRDQCVSTTQRQYSAIIRNVGRLTSASTACSAILPPRPPPARTGKREPRASEPGRTGARERSGGVTRVRCVRFLAAPFSIERPSAPFNRPTAARRFGLVWCDPEESLRIRASGFPARFCYLTPTNARRLPFVGKSGARGVT
jgi:hypothetical protein